MGIIDDGVQNIKRNLTQVEQRTDLRDDEKITRIINICAAICAGVACQPIPFADIFILTPIQAYMGSRIACVRGVPVTEGEAGIIIKQIAGVIGLGLLAQQLAIGAYKTFIPILGGFTTVPLVYGLTYGIGRVMDAYFVARAQGIQLSEKQIHDVFDNAKKEGKSASKKHDKSSTD